MTGWPALDPEVARGARVRSGLARPAVLPVLVLVLVLVTVLGRSAPALASSPDEGWAKPPPSLPESINGVIRRTEQRPRPVAIDRLRDVFAALQACWRPPGRVGSGAQVTIRLSFKRSGDVLGQPRITYFRPGRDAEAEEAFRRSVAAAFQACTPLPFTDSLGAAVAGRPFTFRFVDDKAI